jgi:hypothetical protein
MDGFARMLPEVVRCSRQTNELMAARARTRALGADGRVVAFVNERSDAIEKIRSFE